MRWRLFTPAAVASALLVLTATAAQAKGHLQVQPTLVEMQPKAAAGRILLTNTGDSPVSAQVRVFAWTQESGEDRLSATTDIVLSPPILEIAPGQQQVIRLVRTGQAATNQDRSYRVVVEELPNTKALVDTIKLRMRYVMPLFVRAAEASDPQLMCSSNSIVLSCRNTGGQAAQLGKTHLSDDQGRSEEITAGLFGYVLPSSQRQWTLNLKRPFPPTANLRLDTQLNGQMASISVARTP